MKKLIAILAALLLIGSAALADVPPSCYPLGYYEIRLPRDWDTSYNSDISILTKHQMPNKNYDHILTAVLMGLGDPIEDDYFYGALCDLITSQHDITANLEEDMEINGDRVYLWSGYHKDTEGAGAIYCHGDTALIVIHVSYGLDEQERLDYERALIAQITTTDD